MIQKRIKKKRRNKKEKDWDEFEEFYDREIEYDDDIREDSRYNWYDEGIDDRDYRERY